MGKKREETRGKMEEAKEKPIFGSGAEPKPEPKDDGLVRCVCTVACAWKGYHDEGDKVMIDRKLMESDAFIKGHFKPLDPLPEGQCRQDEGQGEGQGEGEGADGNGQGELGLK